MLSNHMGKVGFEPT